MIRHLVLGSVAALVPVCALAADLSLPGAARNLTEQTIPLDSYHLPVGPYDAGEIPTRRFEGRVDRWSWRLDGAAVTTLQVLDPLRAQIRKAGFDLVFECEDRACGGFDFRFGIDVIPAPNMHVDIRNYRFVAAVRGSDEAVSLLVSRSRNAAYIQIIRVRPPDAPGLSVSQGGETPMPEPETGSAGGLIEILVANGHVILGDLDFKPGENALGPGPHASLEQLAGYLSAHPDQRIALVGHTDSTGSLAANIALSKRRAAAVKDRLVGKFDVAPDRVEAEGMGYLAPVATNLTKPGREANRRVEAILLSSP